MNKYEENLQRAAAWLLKIRNSDNAWGKAPDAPSSIVNTAEAIFVLVRANTDRSTIDSAIAFLRKAIVDHPKTRGEHLRFYAYCALALLEAGYSIGDPTLKFCADWLKSNQRRDFGWGHKSRDLSNESSVTATFFALWILQRIGSPEYVDNVNNGLTWLLSVQNDDDKGWGIAKDYQSNVACTSYALYVLVNSAHNNEPKVIKAKEWLLGQPQWDTLVESIPGTTWQHCSWAWATISLLNMGCTIYEKPIIKVIKKIEQLHDSKEGGWNENPISPSKSVWSTMWATLALDNIRKYFLPSDLIHIDNKLSLSNAQESLPLSLKLKGLMLSFSIKSFPSIMIMLIVIGILLQIPTLQKFIFGILGIGIFIISISLLFIHRKEINKFYEAYTYLLLILATLFATFQFFGIDMNKIIGFFTKWFK